VVGSLVDDILRPYPKADSRRKRRKHAHAHDLVITEVARRNGRSIRAHEGVGFELLCRYAHADGAEWDVIGWDWRNG